MADAIAIEETLIQARANKPFLPFTVVTTRGDRHPVKRRLGFAAGYGHLIIVKTGPKRPTVYLTMDEVKAIEFRKKRSA